MRKKRKNLVSALPVDFLYNLPVIEFTGNRRAVIEGSTGVLRYSEDNVKIKTRKYILSFSGRGLRIKCISPTCVIVEGFILDFEFII